MGRGLGSRSSCGKVAVARLGISPELIIYFLLIKFIGGTLSFVGLLPELQHVSVWYHCFIPLLPYM